MTPLSTTPTQSEPPDENKNEPLVLQDLRQHLRGKKSGSSDDTGVALPVAAIKSLLGVIQRSEATTMMQLQEELRKASSDMLEYAKTSSHFLLGGRSNIALASGCELFMKYVTRCFLELPDFQECIDQVLERGERFANISVAARDRISSVGQAFVRDGMTVLTHGWSRVVAAILTNAATTKHFSIVVLEGRPDASGVKAAKLYSEAGIPCTVVLDSAMGHVMEKVDLVVVGAEGVVENGGIVNKIGTYALAIAAKELGKPFYVAAESYKFARMFPLNQSDLPDMGSMINLSFVDTASWEVTYDPKSTHDHDLLPEHHIHKVPGLQELPTEVNVYNPPCDYTPAKYITLLFTDLGVLTPSAVSDELIRLYQ